MRWAASPNACAEAPRLLTLAAGRGAWRAGEGLGSCSERPSGASWVASTALERSSARGSAASARSSARRALSSARALERWSVGAMGRRGPGRCFERPVRWLRELGVLPRRPFRPRPRTLPAPGSAPHLPAALWSRRSAGLCAPTRWPSERRRGHGRRRHTFSGAEGGERPARTRSYGLPLAGSLVGPLEPGPFLVRGGRLGL